MAKKLLVEYDIMARENMYILKYYIQLNRKFIFNVSNTIEYVGEMVEIFLT